MNDRTTKSAYFGVYILNFEKGWREITRKLPSRIKGVTSMDVSHSRRMIAVASSDMAVNIFHMDTFAVISFFLALELMCVDIVDCGEGC